MHNFVADIMKKDTTTEEKIKEAAKQVFMAKGFAGCSSREIAKAAGMNVALVNYYFRSKSQLFELIFNTAMEDFVLSLISVFSTDLPLEDKLRIFIDKEYDFLSAHPDLPAFIINEMNRCETCHAGNNLFEKVKGSGILDECLRAQEKGDMRKVNVVSITLLIMANCHFPFMAGNLIQTIHGLSDSQYEEQLILHKQYVTEMLINYLFPKNK